MNFYLPKCYKNSVTVRKMLYIHEYIMYRNIWECYVFYENYNYFGILL